MIAIRLYRGLVVIINGPAMPPGRKASFEIFPWTSEGLWGKRVKSHCFNELSSGNKFNVVLLFPTKLN